MNKTILDLKREVDTIEKTQSEGTLEMETISGKRGPLVLQTFYASVQGNAWAKKWEWVCRGVRGRVWGTFGIALET